MAITFSNIGLQEPSTVTKSVASVTITRNSSAEYQEILTMGDPETAAALARVVAAAPDSTHYGLVVRIAQPSTGPFQISSVAGNVTVSAVTQTAASYFPVRIVDSSGTGFAPISLDYTDGSTTSTLAAPSLAFNNSSNNTMRLVGITQPWPVQLVKSYPTRNSTTVTVNSSASSAFYSLISSVASVAPCVYAYSVTSTAVTPMLVEFVSDTSAPKWGILIGSASSGVTGANLAVAPPGAIFQGGAGSAINVRLGSTAVNVQVSVSWFTE